MGLGHGRVGSASPMLGSVVGKALACISPRREVDGGAGPLATQHSGNPGTA